LGKWFASLTLLAALVAPLLLFPALVADKAALPWLVILCGMAGLFLVGACYLAAGLFFSALTENQIVAAALSFGCLLFLFILGWLDAINFKRMEGQGVRKFLCVRQWLIEVRLQPFA
jgi:ABC-2 type transport system permease protein